MIEGDLLLRVCQWENRVYTDKLITYSISFDQIEVHHKHA